MYKVVLLRHGESVWNKENLFTGWTRCETFLKRVWKKLIWRANY